MPTECPLPEHRWTSKQAAFGLLPQGTLCDGGHIGYDEAVVYTVTAEYAETMGLIVDDGAVGTP